VFAFLYLLVAVYGALLFERPGALVTAALGGGSYGAVLLASRAFEAEWAGGGAAQPLTVTLTVWAIHTGAIVLVAALASFLAAELRRTGEALRQRTSALRHLTDLHRRTVESLMSGLLTTDAEGRITSFNPEAERITGLSGQEALGLELERVLPDLRELAVRHAGGPGAPPRVRIPHRNARGQDLHLGLAAYVLREADGQPSGHVVIFQDVTDVVEMEAELRRSERLAGIGELSASIAHEIRNPLAAISGSIQILQKGGALGQQAGETRRLMDIVLRETDRLNHLITDFLQYARPGPIQPEPVALEAAISDLLEIYGAVLPEAVELHVELEAGIGVHADPAQLRQLLWNLMLNACQAMPEGGRLAIAAHAAPPPAPQDGASSRRKASQGPEAWVEIAVRDQGVGIPPEALERIFDPFFTTRSDGSGLGLATVHRIVQEHGGSIRLESSVGAGTVVRVRLPRSEVTS
jgi:two-component system sensor histidine kinase PilS (NtrC family)